MTKKGGDTNKKDKDLLGIPGSFFHGSTQMLNKAPSMISQLEADFRTKIDSMELECAEGKAVDILILASEENPEWKMEWSSIESLNDLEEDLAPAIDELENNNRNNIYKKWRDENQSRLPDINIGGGTGGNQAEIGVDSNALMAGAFIH